MGSYNITVLKERFTNNVVHIILLTAKTFFFTETTIIALTDFPYSVFLI